MKATVVMLSFLVTLFLSWMILGVINYTFFAQAEATFKQAVTEGGVLLFMFVLGWIPAVVVSIDIESKLE